MSERGHYVDVPVIGVDEGAFGPAETEARLRLGLEPLADYVLHDGPIVASGDMVITEHAEEWTWASGEHVRLPFTLGDGGARRARSTAGGTTSTCPPSMNAAPAAWVDSIAGGYK